MKAQTAVQNRAYYDTHADELKARAKIYGKKYYAEHSEIIKARSRAAYAADPARAHARCADWWRRNKAKARVWEKAWRAKNKAKIRAYEHTRRALEIGAGRVDPKVIEVILSAERCAYCACELVRQKPFHPQKVTIEHRQPLSRGGTNDPSNLVAACARCNFSKNDRTEAEFLTARRSASVERSSRDARAGAPSRCARR